MSINPEVEKKVDQYIQENWEAMVEDIKALVSIRSVSVDGEDGYPFGEGCAKVLAKGLEIGTRMGFKAINYEDHCGSLTYGDQEEEIGLFSHLDVVPEGNDWNYAPFDPVVENGYIIGRGACDNKGAAITSMYAVKFLMENNIPLKHKLRIFLGCNEESGMSDLLYYLTKEKAPRFSLIPDSDYPVCIGEKGMISADIKFPPLKGNIVSAHGGLASNMVADRAEVVLSGLAVKDVSSLPDTFTVEEDPNGVKITAKGIATHAAMPEGSVNAIYLLFSTLLEKQLIVGEQTSIAQKIVQILSDYNGAGLGIETEDAPSGKLTHIGGVLKQEGESYILNCNIRYPVTAKSEDILARLEKKVAEYGACISRHFHSDSCYVSEDRPEIQALMNVYREVTKDDAPTYVMGGGTYARRLPNAVAFGPESPRYPSPFGGEHGGIHQPDESVSIAALKETVKIYALALIELDRVLD